jgi:hypothetical protein
MAYFPRIPRPRIERASEGMCSSSFLWGDAANPLGGRKETAARRCGGDGKRFATGEPGKRAKGRRAPELAALQENGDAERGTTYRTNG